MKYILIEEYKNYPVTVYFDRGRYFVDFKAKQLYRNPWTKAEEYVPLPICSYSTLEAAKEAIYYYYN